jgi:cytidyltransferase-like protein
MKSLVIGRFQPFHDGHYALVQTLLDEGKDVVVAIRDTPFNEDNPYSVFERRQMIHHALGDGVETVVIPDIEEVIYGRKVGWKIREIILDESTQRVTAEQEKLRLLEISRKDYQRLS